MNRIFLSLAGFVTVFRLTPAPIRFASLAMPKLQKQAQSEAETFYGTILKDGKNFVLSDSATKSRYTLDDAKKVRRYEGMTVKVTGTIDTAGNVIHVETIQPIV